MSGGHTPVYKVPILEERDQITIFNVETMISRFKSPSDNTSKSYFMNVKYLESCSNHPTSFTATIVINDILLCELIY